MFVPDSVPTPSPRFRINRYRRLAWIGSGIAVVLSLLGVLLCWLNPGIGAPLRPGLDFTGGTLVEVGFSEAVDLTEVRSALTADGFGDATVFMERLVEGARHIEVQVIADTHGNVWAVGVRDCSVQRRHQKLIEESSSPVLTAEQQESIKAAAARLCLEAGYRNAGTVEFLYDPRTREFAFMEVNARLQVEQRCFHCTVGCRCLAG